MGIVTTARLTLTNMASWMETNYRTHHHHHYRQRMLLSFALTGARVGRGRRCCWLCWCVAFRPI